MIDPKTNPLIGVPDLAALGTSERVTILDCSWYLPQEVRDPLVEYELGHIPGARFFDWESCSGGDSTEACLYLPTGNRFAAHAAALGIREGDLVVAYDHEGFHAIAARAWWMFRVFGHERVVVLEGGLKAWKQAGLLTEGGVPPAPAPAERRGAEFDSRLVRTFDDLRANIEAGAEQVVDVRSRERYLGAGNGPDKRPGHIPGAVSLPFAECLEKGANVFRPLGELAEKGKGAGIDPDKPLVAYCGGGGSSPVVALGYYLLGKRDVAIYDGAWHDWCRHGEAPIERGAPESP